MTTHLLLLTGLLLAAPPAEEAAPPEPSIQVPDEELIDQDGRRVRLHTDVMAGHRVALQFIFTQCTTICSPMAAVFGKLEDVLANDSSVRLVSISLDPAHDDAAALRTFSAKFGRGPAWTLLTGDAARIARVTKAFGVSPSMAHAPLTILGDPATGEWRRVHGLASAEELAKNLRGLGAGRDAASPPSASPPPEDPAAAAARDYFTNTPLVDQEGRRLRFYDELIRGKIVIINFGFTSCSTACSPITANLARVQALLGDRVGRDIHMVTISVDPEHDTPLQLNRFAARFGVKPGWFFLTGQKRDVDAVLKKLGGFAPNPAEHGTTLIIGDARTGNFVKTVGTNRPENIAHAATHINDEP